MKHKYSIVNFMIKTPGSDSFTAASKARMDIDEIARNNSIDVYNIKANKGKGTLFVQLSIAIALLKILFKIDRVVIQYPPLIGLRMLHLVNKIFRRKVVYLIHDVEYLRFGKNGTNEILNLNKADAIISHTPNMTESLTNNGISKPIVNMYLFDYLSNAESENSYEQREDETVVFAGNLKKSHFLYDLKTIMNVRFSLYGIFFENNMGG